MAKEARGGKRANHRLPIKIPGSSKDFHYVNGSTITNERVFAGYRQRNTLNEVVTKGLTAGFDGKERLW